MRLLTVALCTLILVFFTSRLFHRSAGVEAGTTVKMDVAELTLHADLILEARVLGAQTQEDDGKIETEYLLQVERTFRGADQAYRSLRLPGGVLPDGRGMTLAGMPRIDTGDDVLIFLSQEGELGVRMPVGLSQGMYEVLRRPGRPPQLVRDSAGVTLLHPDTGRLSHPEGITVREYADVVAEIEAALATRRGR